MAWVPAGVAQRHRIGHRRQGGAAQEPARAKRGQELAPVFGCGQPRCVVEKLGIRVTDDGMTVIDPKAKAINVATNWKDLSACEDFLVERLAGRRSGGAPRKKISVMQCYAVLKSGRSREVTGTRGGTPPEPAGETPALRGLPTGIGAGFSCLVIRLVSVLNS